MKNKKLITVMLAVAVSMSTSLTAMAKTTSQSSTPSQYSQLFKTETSATEVVGFKRMAEASITPIYGKLQYGIMEINKAGETIKDTSLVETSYGSGKRIELTLLNSTTKEVTHITTINNGNIVINGTNLSSHFISSGLVAEDTDNWYIGMGADSKGNGTSFFTDSFLLTVSKKSHSDGKTSIPDSIVVTKLKSDCAFVTGYQGNSQESYVEHLGKRQIFLDSGELRYVTMVEGTTAIEIGEVLTEDDYNSRIISKECVDFKITDDNKVYIKTVTGDIKVWNGSSFEKVN